MLADHYNHIRKSIVAFIPKYASDKKNASPPSVAPIIGTGFIAREDGVIVTNDHVIQAFYDQPRPDGIESDDWGVEAMLLYPSSGSLLKIHFEIAGIARMRRTKRTPMQRPARPDIGIVRVKATGLPALSIAVDSHITEGLEVATAGYPMGLHALDAPGGFQLTPTLQRGIISAVLPFPSPKPRSFSINIMTHGGASGSPVFLTDSGETVGILFSALNDLSVSSSRDVYEIPTSISYAVPAWKIASAMKLLDNAPTPRNADSFITLDEILCKSDTVSIHNDGVCVSQEPSRPGQAPDFRVEEMLPGKYNKKEHL